MRRSDAATQSLQSEPPCSFPAKMQLADVAPFNLRLTRSLVYSRRIVLDARNIHTQKLVCTVESKFERRFREMNNQINWLLHPPLDGPRATIMIRVMAGTVFLWEGILKFVYANQGVGRFTKLGFPAPDLTASFVGGLEIVGGLLLILGLGTRFVAVPFLFEMVVAMLSTKVGLYLGTSP